MRYAKGNIGTADGSRRVSVIEQSVRANMPSKVSVGIASRPYTHPSATADGSARSPNRSRHHRLTHSLDRRPLGLESVVPGGRGIVLRGSVLLADGESGENTCSDRCA